jgi:hypothetical protein
MAQDILVLKNGTTYEGDLIDVSETSIIFKVKDRIAAQTISLEIVESVLGRDGITLYNANNTGNNDSTVVEEKLDRMIIDQHIRRGNIVVPQHNYMYRLGALLIAGSGVVGIYNTNRECVDCDFEDLEDFVDQSKSLNNAQYFMLLFGGLFIAFDELIIEQ